MRFPRWAARPAVALSLAAAALAGFGGWAWSKLGPELDVKIGPGARLSARVSFSPVPPVVPLALPSGRYMRDDVQYFPPGPDMPWANTQAATQQARMQATGMGLTPPDLTAEPDERAR